MKGRGGDGGGGKKDRLHESMWRGWSTVVLLAMRFPLADYWIGNPDTVSSFPYC